MLGKQLPIVLIVVALTTAAAPGATGDLNPASLSPSEQSGGQPVALSGRLNQDIIVYTAHQNWLSRIYLLDMNGAVITYWEYEFYFFADLEVVNNEVYVAEAFAPRVYKLDLETGSLEVVIDDWSLYYFYDLAFDGTYFYVTEWDLNRYDITGDKDGMAPFDQDTHGGAWDGSYYWTLNDQSQITCWDVSGWPAVTEVPANAFSPPTVHCRGLWFDGQCFWTAESIDGMLGRIYQFDYNGKIVEQWPEPAFQGWSACLVRGGLPGDFDGDGDVDLSDFATFALCFSNGATTPPPGCSESDFTACDLDDDDDVDLTDFATFALHFTG